MSFMGMRISKTSGVACYYEECAPQNWHIYRLVEDARIDFTDDSMDEFSKDDEPRELDRVALVATEPSRKDRVFAFFGTKGFV